MATIAEYLLSAQSLKSLIKVLSTVPANRTQSIVSTVSVLCNNHSTTEQINHAEELRRIAALLEYAKDYTERACLRIAPLRPAYAEALSKFRDDLALLIVTLDKEVKRMQRTKA